MPIDLPYLSPRTASRAVLILLALLTAVPARAQKDPDAYICLKPVPSDASRAEKRKAKDLAARTFCFDHYYLRAVGDVPTVLRVEDGEFFGVKIGNTDPTLFTYTITAVPKEEADGSMIGATGAAVAAKPRDWTSLTMRHSDAFVRYRVIIAARSDLAPKPGKPDEIAKGSEKSGGRGGAARPSRVIGLHPATFDVWVETVPGIEVSFTGGVAFSNLKSSQWFSKTDDKGTPDKNDDTATIEEDREARDRFRPDTIAVTSIRDPNRFGGLGLAFGVGLNNDADPRYFAGPSYFLGKNVLLHGGWTGGRVDRLPTGQELGQAPILGDKTLTELPKRFRHGFYLGISFAFVPNAKENFVAAFASSQEGTEKKEEAEPAAETNEAAVDLAEWKGDYLLGADAVVVDVTEKQITLKGGAFGAGTSLATSDKHAYSGKLDGADVTCRLLVAEATKTIECTDAQGTNQKRLTKK